MSEEKKQYDKPMTFVNAKRIRTGDKTTKGADKTTVTFGLMNDFKTNQEVNTADQLIAALEQYRGKQINLVIYVQDKEHEGRKFQSAFVGVTEMIPKDQQQGKTAFVPKNQSRSNDIKAKADSIRTQFENK